MSEEDNNSAKSNNRDRSGGNITDGGEPERVGKEERRRRVLDFLYDTGGAFPPMVIYRNIRNRGADYQRRSIDNYLPELAEEGLVEKIDPEEFENRRIVTIPIDEDGYYRLTEKGEGYVESYRQNQSA